MGCDLTFSRLQVLPELAASLIAAYNGNRFIIITALISVLSVSWSILMIGKEETQFRHLEKRGLIILLPQTDLQDVDRSHRHLNCIVCRFEVLRVCKTGFSAICALPRICIPKDDFPSFITTSIIDTRSTPE